MSTKIYNAYRYEGKNIESLIAMLRKIMEKHIVQRAFEINANLSDEAVKSYWGLIESITNASKKMMRNPLSVEASAAVYFVDGKIYVQFFEVSRNLLKPYKRYLKDWHYQNSSASHNGIDKSEWKERERFWDKLYKHHCRPCDVGLCFDFTDANAVAREIMKLRGRIKDEKDEIILLAEI